MPRIAPEQLIKCLAVLLTPGGGIKSTEEVGRLVQLMQKFSKKLVSKCVYVSILKNTELGLLSDFMQHGGWALVFSWLQKAIDNQNQFFIQEILDLLVICPVDVTRLKSNNIPKLVKTLSKNSQIGGGVQDLASKIVAKWLAIVKGVAASVESTTAAAEPQEESKPEPVPVLKITLKKDGKNLVRTNSSQDEESEDEPPIVKVTKSKKTEDSHVKTKSSSRDSSTKHKSSSSDSKHRSSSDKRISDKHSNREHSTDKQRSSENRDKSSSDKSRSSRDKEKEKEKDRSSKYSSSASSSSSSKNYLKERERERERTKRKEKEKEEKDTKLTKIEKDRQVETDQATLARLMVPSINKLGKIPKKTDKEKINQLKENIGKSDSSGENKEKPAAPAPPSDLTKKNYSFSIEKRTPSDQKPKTVKTFNAKFRSTGLEEETAKPPPSRGKATSSSSSSSSSEKKSVKRPSPTKDLPLPPEKKLKTTSDHSTPSSSDKSSSPSEKSKVTPPKAKVMFLQESDVFSSALNDATLIKDSKKKKRKLSTSKDDPKEKENKVTSPTRPKMEDNKPAFKFYRDTLESIPEEKKQNVDTDIPSDTEHNVTPPLSPTEECLTKPASEDNDQLEPHPQELEKCKIEFVSRPPDQPIKGVLSYLKDAKRVKKSVHFKSPEQGLEDVFYFELDETERCNVTRPNSFTDMRSMERELERENFHIARKISQEDVQSERTVWTGLIPIDVGTTTVVDMGKNSREKEIQKARQMTVKPTIYGGYNVIPPSPAEPDFEIHTTTDPLLMPTEDATSEGTCDYRTMPWPEPLPSESYYSAPMPPPANMMVPMMGPGPIGMMPPGMFPPGGPFPPAPLPNGNNWMGPPGDMVQPGGIPMGGPIPPNMTFPPGMGPPMGMNMGPMMNGPMPPEMMMNGPPGFPPMGPPGMFGMGPPGPWFGPGGPGMDMNQGPPNMDMNQGPPNMDMNQGPPNMSMKQGPMNDIMNSGESKSSSRSKPSGGSWHRGGVEPNRDRDRGRDRERERDRDKRGGRPRGTIPCRHKKFCKTRDCPYMHPSSR